MEEAAEDYKSYFEEMPIRTDFIPTVLMTLQELWGQREQALACEFDQPVVHAFGYVPGENMWVLRLKQRSKKGKQMLVGVFVECMDSDIVNFEWQKLEKLNQQVVWFT